jgi:uncharacterized protein with PIN domain
MASPVWVQKLKAQLEANPLYCVGSTSAVRCRACGGSGKKVPLYRITNYNEFRTCDTCGKVYR